MTKLSTTPPGGGCTGHIVKPANTHDLMIITTNIKDVLIHGIPEYMPDADLLNLSERRTPENILPILSRILWLQFCKQEGEQDTLYSSCSIFTEKKGGISLVSLLGSKNPKYTNNPEQLLHDLGVYDAYYFGLTERMRGEKKNIISPPNVLQKILHEAVTILLQGRNGYNKNLGTPQVSDFTVSERGIVSYSKRVSHLTVRNGGETVSRVLRILDELLEMKKSETSIH